MIDYSDTTCEGTLNCNKEEDNNGYLFYGLLASTSIAAAMIGYGVYSCAKVATQDAQVSTIERLSAAGIAKRVME